MWLMLFWRHSVIINKRNWGKFFTKIVNWLTPTNKDKKVTYSNSTLELWTERKYTIELIQVKSCKKGLAFLVAKTPKEIRNHFLKLAKVLP